MQRVLPEPRLAVSPAAAGQPHSGRLPLSAEFAERCVPHGDEQCSVELSSSLRDGHAVRFLVTCRYRRRTICVVARIGDRDLAELSEHTQRSHPDEKLGAAPGVEEILQHFQVELYVESPNVA